jgi:hypothetical protein
MSSQQEAVENVLREQTASVYVQFRCAIDGKHPNAYDELIKTLPAADAYSFNRTLPELAAVIIRHARADTGFAKRFEEFYCLCIE